MVHTCGWKKRERDRGMNKQGLLGCYVAKWFSNASPSSTRASICSYSFENMLFCVCLTFSSCDYIQPD